MFSIALKNRCVQGSAAEEFCSAVKKDLILGPSDSGRVGHPEQISFKFIQLSQIVLVCVSLLWNVMTVIFGDLQSRALHHGARSSGITIPGSIVISLPLAVNWSVKGICHVWIYVIAWYARSWVQYGAIGGMYVKSIQPYSYSIQYKSLRDLRVFVKWWAGGTYA